MRIAPTAGASVKLPPQCCPPCNRAGLQDLIRAAQLEVLLAQPANLLALLTRRQLRPRAGLSLVLTQALAQRLRVDAETAAICVIGRSFSNVSRMPRWITSSGYFFGRGMSLGGSPSARTSSWLLSITRLETAVWQGIY
jgi:hypothetical protein